MKKALVLLLVLVPCLPLVAIDFGIGADVYMGISTEKVDTSKATETVIELMPAVVMRMSPQLELRPYVIIGSLSEKDPDGISGAINDDLSSFYLGVGAGAYYAFIQRELVSVLIGPKAVLVLYFEPSGASAPGYQRYFVADIQVSLPIYLDVKLKDKLFLRGGIEILGLLYQIDTNQLAGVKNADNSFTLLDYWNGVPVVYLGFYYMFK